MVCGKFCSFTEIRRRNVICGHFAVRRFDDPEHCIEGQRAAGVGCRADFDRMATDFSGEFRSRQIRAL